ncbi:TetR/AcrR family transcriptional regulator [Chloroflexia bacterium SDU3-3]|nr:TetR/AcrR family transcriptional regulator [Chloroflexia bacterium SDU3-3]
MAEQKPRGRPRTFDRQAALGAAMIHFWAHGYEGTSISDLTAAMGVTAPTLYAAFGSKEQLYREALQQYFQQGMGGWAAALHDDTPAYSVLKESMHMIAERFTHPGRPRGCMVSTASLYCAAENEAARQIAADLRDVSFRMLLSKLERAKATGELPAEVNVVVLARFYSAVVEGMSVQAVDGASTAELHALVDVALAAWPGQRPN